MKALSAREIKKREFHGNTNIMTPHVIKVGKAGRNRAWELSWGEAMAPTKKHPRLYGVTVVDVDEKGNTSRPWRESKSFPTLEMAEEYIEALK